MNRIPTAAQTASVPPTVVAPTARWTTHAARSRGPALRASAPKRSSSAALSPTTIAPSRTPIVAGTAPASRARRSSSSPTARPSPGGKPGATIVAHGFPPGEGLAGGLELERRAREAGAVPATIGVLDGAIVVGLSAAELERFGADARKAGPRDLAACVVQRAVGATTVGGTLAVCVAVGIRFMGTGGLGGVHRGFPQLPDVSADLGALARTQALVVSSGIKSLLDVPATAELLESLG